MKYRTRSIIWILSVAIAVLAVAGGGCGRAQTPQELLQLGEKYLLEQEYEPALAQFLKVIELEPMRPRAYTGAAEAYTGLGRLADAITVLETGWDITGDADIGSMLQRLLAELAAAVRREAREGLLHKLYELFAEGQENEALELINHTADFQELCEDIDVDEPMLYLPENARGVGIYRGIPSRYGEFYVYFGGYTDEKRAGDGLWVIVNEDEYYRFAGSWSDDAPNGPGAVQEWYGSLHEGMSYRNKIGELAGGLWEGEMLWNFVYPEHTESFPVHFRGGALAVLDVEEDEEGMNYVMSRTGSDPEHDGDAKMSTMRYTPDMTWGVAGFEDQQWGITELAE